MERVFGLDLLRAIAVLMVLAAHCRFLLLPLLPWTETLSIFGFLGVELFFVLSGFLIGGIILRTFPEAPGLRSLAQFWIRRWFRTLPNYYLFLVLNLLLWTSQGYRTAGLLSYWGFLQNLWWECRRFFNESWSLAVEEWFYLLFPILLLLGSRLRPRLAFACGLALSVLFLLSTGARVVAVATSDPSWDAGLRKVVVYRLDALMVGVLGAYLKAYRPGLWRRLTLPLVPVGLLLFAVVASSYYGANRNDSVFARTWMFNATSFAVFAFLPILDRWRSARGWLADWTRNVSLWSYSLYLCHLPLQEVLKALFGDPRRLGLGMGTGRIAAVSAAFVVLAIACSALTYRFFEKPAMDLRERFR
jgi:peptidoglycan/LPS O-acetylase OafA/YrhL